MGMKYRNMCINCGEVDKDTYDTLPEAQYEGPLKCKKCGSNMVPTMEI
jgi:formate dehydrogenase maturation protein FdhE